MNIVEVGRLLPAKKAHPTLLSGAGLTATSPIFGGDNRD